MRLKPSDLGKTEKFGGEEVWTHMVFADKALNLAKRAGINGGSSSIWQVRDHLPDIIKEKVSKSQTSWQSFCDAIKAVELGHIRDGVKKHKEKMVEKEVMTARLARLESIGAATPPSPTAGIRNQMSRTTITSNQPNQVGGERPANNPNANPFNAGGGRGNLFIPGAPRAPATEAQKQAVRTRIATYPLQPDTPEGQGTYREQLRAWREQFGADQRATELTGFPLRPGSDPPASGECYACGRTGHNRSNCNEPNLTNPRERAWRAICGSVLGHNRAQRQVAVNIVGNDGEDDMSWLQSAGTEDHRDQGNGGGPSA